MGAFADRVRNYAIDSDQGQNQCDHCNKFKDRQRKRHRPADFETVWSTIEIPKTADSGASSEIVRRMPCMTDCDAECVRTIRLLWIRASVQRDMMCVGNCW